MNLSLKLKDSQRLACDLTGQKFPETMKNKLDFSSQTQCPKPNTGGKRTVWHSDVDNFLTGIQSSFIMLSKRTIIGLIVGSVIIAIGGYSLFTNIGTITIHEDYTLSLGDTIPYTIPAPANTAQKMKITGNAFDLTLQSPADGLQIPDTSYKDELVLDWTHLEDGETKILIKNTGNSELSITGELVRSSDPIWLTYDIMVITSGVIIIGFSMGFTLRKPKGF